MSAPIETYLVDDLAKILRCSGRTVRRRVKEGLIPPPIRLGNGPRVFWLASEIRAWVQGECRHPATWKRQQAQAAGTRRRLRVAESA